MYNNEDAQEYQDNRHESSHPSADSPKDQKNIFSRHRHANSFSQKGNGILGTYSRIVPKKPTHDFQRLYAENIQLKERIKYLEESCKKTKTRLAMTQKQKQQLIVHINKPENGYTGIRQKRGSTNALHRVDEKTKRTSFDENRRILHAYKDEISKLQIENARLKKTVKYTQIQEMEIQNQHLQQQMVRIKEYAHEAANNTDYEEYEKQIQVLQKQLLGEKQHSKTYYLQIKKKDEEIQGVKSKMRALALKKTEMQRKYTRDLTTAQGEAQRAKDKERVIVTSLAFDKKEPLRNKTSQKKQQIMGVSYKQNFEKEKQKVAVFERKLKQKEVQMSKLWEKIKLFQSIAQDDKNSKTQHKINAQNNLVGTKAVEVILQPNQSTEVNKSQKSEVKPASVSKKIRSSKFQSHDEEQNSSGQIYIDDHQESEKPNSDHPPNTQQQSVKNVDKNKSKSSDKQQEKQEELYDESFDQIDQSNKNKVVDKNQESEEEVLFQKQTKPNKAQSKKRKQSQQSKEKVSQGKAIKILQQTIKYRLIAQRYSYADFNRDIVESGATQFTAEQLLEMLSNQPFFLSEDHLQVVIIGVFGRQELQPEDAIKTSAFLSKMKQFIVNFDIPEEEEQQESLKLIQKKLNQNNILPKLKEQAKGEQISKKGFMKVLKEFGKLNEQQIQQCLAEVSIMSEDISRINYMEFVKKIKSL